MDDTGKRDLGPGRLVRGTRYSLAGLAAAVRHEAAFQIELALCAVLVPLGLWLGRSGLERALLVGSLFFVLVVELVNSAAEAIVDRISLERHPLAGRAKDMASAAVFLALLNAALVWLLVLLF